MAHKRQRNVQVDKLQSFNLFTAFGEDGKLKAPRPNLQDLESDEEEDVEELKAKLSGPSKGRVRTKTKPKKKQKKKYADSDEEDDDEVIDLMATPPRKSNENLINGDSPSPPPPPEFNDRMVEEMRLKNRNAAKTFHKLESRVKSYKMSKALAAMDNISPILNNSSDIIDLDTPIVRETITVKVRSRNGLLRFENYPMHESFERIFNELGVSEGVEGRRVRITRKGDNIQQTDTPSSISLHIADILDYVIVDGITPAIAWYPILAEEDFVRVMLRTKEKNCKTITKKLAKMETFEKLFQEFADLHEKPLQRLRFIFDGDSVSPVSTPQDLDMSEENVIDVVIT